VNSNKRKRSASQILAAIRDVPLMQGLTLNLSEAESLAFTLKYSREEILEGIKNGLPTTSQDPFKCNENKTNTNYVISRLKKTQLINTLKVLFGSNFISNSMSILNQLPDEKLSGDAFGYLSHYDKIEVGILSTLAKKLSKDAANSTSIFNKLSHSCMQTEGGANNCSELFIRSVGLQFYRRPPIAEEVSKLKNIYNLGGDVKESFEFVLQALLQSPQFLYLVEVGKDSEQAGERELTDYELASRLSYFITDSMPDEELFDLASSGQLKDSILGQQIKRLLATQNAKSKTNDFLSYWLRLDETPNVPKGPSDFLNGLNTNGLKNEFVREAKEYYRNILFVKQGSYKDLMTSKDSFARTPASASVYGHAPISGIAPATMGNPGRIGLALRAPTLISSDFETHPIIRGARFRAQFLCDDMPPPTPDNLNLGEDVNTIEMIRMHSTRKRTDIKTSSPNCVGCHQYINPAGYAFEAFDSFGRFRVSETQYSRVSNGNLVVASHDIDTTGVMPALEGSDATSITIISGANFMEQIAESTQGKACYVKQIFRFYKLRHEKNVDNCRLKNMYDWTNRPKGTLLDVIKAYVLDDKFKKIQKQ